MSSSMAIPTGPASTMEYDRLHPRQAPKPAASSSSSYSSSPSTPEPTAKVSPNSAKRQGMTHHRRPSLLSPAISKQECTTINVGDDGQPRLISYLSSSQGFIWNPEIFLPSYMDCDYVPLENRREPVHEILLSDEEIQKMLPK
ncbi:hypothetical protein QBC33DRAFT_101303 [Phialemonium atrogriseum]|uniref:Uncharacterized protein n=1 Tax=Phialemonium atrogriseum TaxID=1093897 RepID=A0AAJ0FFD2_9PEZI|nr:uncharacterized protein QBC33DRAFT_101303 [Phialemonium atrogriseum]KAK1766481.1 hypothetical protein QBC33DRAFT_101303 [Phialemonium atrogriseum]